MTSAGPREPSRSGRASRSSRPPRSDERRPRDERLRIFLAVFPPLATQEAAARAIERLRRPGDGVSWVKRENLHYTLRFLGDLGEDGARRAAEAAAEAAAGHRAFDARLGGLGAFPDARRARVLWVGLVEGAEPLVELARSLELALRRKGFDRADRPFAAHLTIGRVREAGGDWSAALAEAEKAMPAEGEATRFRVDRVVVVASQLSPKGSIYTPRAEAKLSE
jgi:2'-5' RNA ligase